jgi:MFS family permease
MANLTGGALTGTGGRSRPRAALPALCATQIISWGIVSYAVPVLSPQITASARWPAEATVAAFFTALLVCALAGIRVGRIIDRHGPCTVMTAGPVLGVLSVVLVPPSPICSCSPRVGSLVGGAMAAAFYQPAFGALTLWFASNYVRALTIVALAGDLIYTAPETRRAPAVSRSAAGRSKKAGRTWYALKLMASATATGLRRRPRLQSRGGPEPLALAPAPC